VAGVLLSILVVIEELQPHDRKALHVSTVMSSRSCSTVRLVDSDNNFDNSSCFILTLSKSISQIKVIGQPPQVTVTGEKLQRVDGATSSEGFFSLKIYIDIGFIRLDRFLKWIITTMRASF